MRLSLAYMLQSKYHAPKQMAYMLQSKYHAPKQILHFSLYTTVGLLQ